MSQIHYKPHDAKTRAHYEKLLYDINRCLPPGLHDDIEIIAEQILNIVCSNEPRNNAASELVYEKQRRIEALLDTQLTSEMRDHFLRYGKLITDYVVGDVHPNSSSASSTMLSQQEPQHSENIKWLMNEENSGNVVDNKANTVVYYNSNNQSNTNTKQNRNDEGVNEELLKANDDDDDDSDDDDDDDNEEREEEEEEEEDELAVLTGMTPSKRVNSTSKSHNKNEGKRAKHVLRKDKNLMHYAFDGNDDGENGTTDNNNTLVSVNDRNGLEREDGAFASQMYNSNLQNLIAEEEYDGLNAIDLMHQAYLHDENTHLDDNHTRHDVTKGELSYAMPAAKITFDEVAVNPQYIRDTLRRLLPSQSVETCEVQARKVVQFLSDSSSDVFILETQLTALLGGYDDDAVMK